MSGRFELPSIFLMSCLCASIFCCGCSERDIDLTTPESTIQTYVNAHNSGDAQAMRQCGMATSLKSVFTRQDYDVNSRPIAVPVDGIEYEILASTPGKESVTRMFTMKDTLLHIRFTSRYDREYGKTVEVRLECRRTVYDEEDSWQIL